MFHSPLFHRDVGRRCWVGLFQLVRKRGKSPTDGLKFGIGNSSIRDFLLVMLFAVIRRSIYQY